ncbi:hypothetical protein [Qipengyuania proteolytica]|uniref:hypothetical protein n=1 Tax=Qipengyuania proteolytica TaxID=2867239 RepID=UPI001FFC2DF6|nr:hypothetical protein [Qipengyuania proteolytica]
MDLPPALIQFLGSLFAILALAALARWLKLGPEPRLESDEAAREAADEAISGFVPLRIGRDRDGRGALLSDSTGRVLLLRPHGTMFAGRLLTARASAHIELDVLVIDTAERRFGTARLTLDDPSAWMQAIAAIKHA